MQKIVLQKIIMKKQANSFLDPWPLPGHWAPAQVTATLEQIYEGDYRLRE